MSGEQRDVTLRQLIEPGGDDGQTVETADWLAEGVRHRLAARRRANAAASRRRLMAAVPVTVALVIAGIVWRPAPRTESSERVKGPDASLTLYRQTTVGSEQLLDGSIARPGDIVRVGYKVSQPGFGLIASVDDRGVVTVHYPDSGRAAALRDGDTVLLDQAYELDDAPARERFYLITAAAPFEVGPVVSIIKREAASHDVLALPLPPALTQSTFLLQKDARP